MKNKWLYLSLAMVTILTIQAGCSSDEVITPSAKSIYTTVDRTIVPLAAPSGNTVAIDDPANFAKNGFGDVIISEE